MIFEFDEAKSEANAEKHGIDFVDAQQLWDDPFMLTARLANKGEKRYMILARYAGSCWFGVYTERGDAVRIISVRRAIGNEVSLYDKARNDYR